MKHALIIALTIAVLSCSQEQASVETESVELKPESQEAASTSMDEPSEKPALSLDSILAQQPEEAKARFPYRNPKETIELFGIEPGMSVAEVLPGRGWYSKILIPYLGDAGELIGIVYSGEMAEKIFPQRYQDTFNSFTNDWPTKMSNSGVSGADISAYRFGALDESLNGSMDRILFIRALHHLGRAEDQGGYLTSAIQESFDLLKPGGQVGVVQHQGPEESTDTWAKGSAGYMKKSQVISAFEAAGFTLLEDSPINNNEKDVPSEDDVVWRLPPSLRGAAEDEDLKAKMLEIGESNRMTLVFEKPAQ